MVIICQQCGDKGLSDALVYCYYCQVCAIHRYCLHVLPATLKESVIWYCEDCKLKVGKSSRSYNPMPLLPRTNDLKGLRTVKAAESVSRLKNAENRLKNKVGKSSRSYNPMPLLPRTNDLKGLRTVKAAESASRSKNAANRLKNKLERDVSGSLSISEDDSGKISPCHYHEVHCCENRGKCQQFRRHGTPNGRSSDEEAESVKRKTSWTADCDNTSNPEQSCELHYNESDNNSKKLKRHVGSDGSISDEEGESVKTKTSVVTSVLPNIIELGFHDHKHPIIDVFCSQKDNMDNEYQRQKGLVRGSSNEETEFFKLKTSQGATSDPSGNPKPISYFHAESIIEVHCSEKDEKDQRRRRRRSYCVISDEEAESVEAKTFLTSASKPSNMPNRRRYIHAEPIVEPIWNGLLSLINENYRTIGVVAHLSSLACPKVVEEAKLLPLMLCLEVFPRSDVWPKSFEKWGTSDDQIALFLFPNNEREEMVYDRLVDDMISRDLAMRTLVKNAELLVFTSKILPSHFWRIQTKFYLWGVFRAKQASDIPNAVVPKEVKDLTNKFNLYAQSPVSSLSSSGSYGSVYSRYCPSAL